VAGEKAVALHLGKPLRQHVHEELALELDGIELHGHVAVVMRVVVANATLHRDERASLRSGMATRWA
jgi:hypothetical protein